MKVSSMQDEVWIYENYQKILEKSLLCADQAWFDRNHNHHEAHKFINYSLSDLLNFKTRVIGGMGFAPYDYDYLMTSKNGCIINQKTIDHIYNSYRHMKKNYSQYINNFSTALEDDDNFGGATLQILPENLEVSLFSIRTAFRIFDFQANLDRLNLQPNLHAILEIGGGYGKSLYDWMCIYDIRTAYYVDLPVNIAAAALYFNKRSDKKINFVIEEDDKIEEGCVNFVVPWKLSCIKKVSLVINFNSLHHMTKRSQNYYFTHFIQERSEYFFHQNRLRAKPGHQSEGDLESTIRDTTMQLLASSSFKTQNSDGSFDIWSQFYRKSAGVSDQM